MPPRRSDDGRRLDIAEYCCMICREYPAYDFQKCLDEDWFLFWDLVEYVLNEKRTERKFLAQLHGVKLGG